MTAQKSDLFAGRGYGWPAAQLSFSHTVTVSMLTLAASAIFSMGIPIEKRFCAIPACPISKSFVELLAKSLIICKSYLQKSGTRDNVWKTVSQWDSDSDLIVSQDEVRNNHFLEDIFNCFCPLFTFWTHFANKTPIKEWYNPSGFPEREIGEEMR